MNELLRPLTIDEAVSEFYGMVQNERRDVPPALHEPAETPAEADTRHLLTARYMIGAICPAPQHCSDQSCRRDRTCRHLMRIERRWAARKSSHPRRPPGADALRYAIWVYMSARRAAELQGKRAIGQ